MLLIRQERIHKNWTQARVANAIGTTLSMIQKIETGKRKPSFDVLVKLENLFGMDYRDLFNLPQRQLRDKERDGNPVKNYTPSE